MRILKQSWQLQNPDVHGKKIWKLNFKNQGYSVWNGQIGQVLGCFEHGNEISELQIKYWLSVSQNTKFFLKHPVLLNVCHYNFVHPFVPESIDRYINDLPNHFLSLNNTNSLIDFMFCSKQYPWRNSKTNGQITSCIPICCKQSASTWSLLCWRTSCCSYHNGKYYNAKFRKVGNVD